MGFRFSRRVRLIPGIRLNFSKSGTSVSVGGRGGWVTMGRRGVRTTVGLPGTGISYSESAPWHRRGERAGHPVRSKPSGWPVVVIFLALLALGA